MSDRNGKHEAEPFVFLGQPSHGDVTGGAARGFWRATRLPDSRVWRQYQQGSLLAANFNGLWVTALNLCREGRRVDYFAMQHADIEPEDWWLDTLIAELEARDLDVLGVAVPIKDPHGLTSIALAHDSGDPWRIAGRLTLTELHRLPETFTSADLGRPLLLNTGLWACRFDESWARKVHFTINDRIAVGPNGAYRAQCEPEDWYFSRLCHELGLKIGCTRKVRVAHRGPADFGNARPWGDPFDAAYAEASLVPAESPTGAFVLPDIEGWLEYDEGKALAELARGCRVLEVGSYCGLSTVCMARTAESVTSYDPHDGRGTPRRKDTLAEFKANLERYGLTNVDIVPRCFAEAREEGRGGRVILEDGTPCYYPTTQLYWYDLVFIDGAHDRDSIEEDIRHAIEALSDDGLLAFHDYGGPHIHVTSAVDALVDRGGTILNLVGSVAVVKPPVNVPSQPIQLQEA